MYWTVPVMAGCEGWLVAGKAIKNIFLGENM